MAITLSSPISADLMYQFYDNKAITPQIRAALQKRQDEEDAKSGEKASSASSANSSKFGPATRVDITDQIVRMNMSKNSSKTEKKEETPATAQANSDKTTVRKPSRYDVLEEVKKSVAARESAAKAEKDAKLKEIADKVSAGNSPEG